MNFLLRLTVLIYVGFFWLKSFVSGSYFFVSGPGNTRDEAEFCCNKYGMTLPSIHTESENTFLHDSIVSLGYTKIWIGVITDSLENLTWADGTNVNYTNWDSSSLANLDSFYNGSWADNSVCVYADATADFKWFVVPCSEKTNYGCEIVIVEPPPKNTNLTSVLCPELEKYTARNISRQVDPGFRYGYFQKEAIFSTIGSPLDMITSFHGVEDCTLRCLAHAECNDIIILNNLVCLLYKVDFLV